MKPSVANSLLEKVKKDYNEIAEDFAKTREKLWPEILFFKNYIKKGERILDIGCGSGRLFGLFKEKDIEYFGIDFSKKMIEIAKRKYLSSENEGNKNLNILPTFIVVDALQLPFEEDFFDRVFSIAVFHHIPSEEKRLLFLKEIKRVLKREGEVYLTVWNLWQRKYILKILKSAIKKMLGKSNLDFCDIFVPFGNRERYYHCFRKKEILGLFKEAGFEIKEIKKLKRNGRVVNIYIRAKKKLIEE